ncbi:MAG: glutamine synthetase family protein, partial [Candidatus Dormibacteraceae bacterium]
MGSEGRGKGGFVEEHELLTDEQRRAGEKAKQEIERLGIRTVRVIWVDQHGVPRCKFASSENFFSALESGLDFSGALINMDSGNHLFTAVFAEGGGLGIPELTGFPDLVLVPDPTTFRVLPWSESTGWVLADAYFSNGKPMPLDSRALLRAQLAEARQLGYEYVAGIELEFYIVRLDSPRIELDQTGWPPPAPKVSILEQGYQYLSEVRLAGVNDILTVLRDHLEAIGLPLRSMEDEWGPGQLEFTLNPTGGLSAADNVVLLRTAVKQICAQHGLHATFMCRPGLPNFFSSGWHLHQSLRSLETDQNAFMSETEILSEVATRFAAGVMEHALAMTAFSTPTINGYKRYKPYSFAPDNVNWAIENRGAFIRVQAAAGDPSSHLENRMGEPAANPYLYIAANLAAGLDGIRRQLEAPPMAGADPYANRGADLPGSLWQAVDLLDKDAFFRKTFGKPFVNFFVNMKRAEVGRFLSE